MTTETYLCPICSLVRMAYGTNCKEWLDGCEGAKTPNVNGAWYLQQLGQVAGQQEAASVGIAAISDEEKETK